jgi:hypothetical protein
MRTLSISESNAKSLENYCRKLTKARAKFDHSFRRLGTATNVAIRARNRVIYIEEQLAAVREAMQKNEPFRKPKEKKAKGIRAVDL